MNIRNAKYNEDGSIDSEILHPVHGWIPFTATYNDIEEHGRLIYASIIDGDAGPIAPYEPEVAIPPTFEELKAYLVREVDRTAAAKRNAVVSNISPAEMSSWSIKRDEALKFQATGNAADAPNLQVEADARDVTLATLVAKVLAKANSLAYLEAVIAGHSGKLQDQLNAVDSGVNADLELVDITAGWPV